MFNVLIKVEFHRICIQLGFQCTTEQGAKMLKPLLHCLRVSIKESAMV